MQCPNCSGFCADTDVECAACGVVFAKWAAKQLASASFIEDMPRDAAVKEALAAGDVAAALAADRPAPVLGKRHESWLLVLSFPVVIPSLMLNWVMASRWGRVDFVLLAADAFILTLLTVRSPLLFFMTVVAFIASVFLWSLRRDKTEQGIFLGYSNAVAYPLIFGGALFAWGFMTLIPWSVYNTLMAALGSEKTVAARRMSANMVGFHKNVRLDGASLDWKKRMVRVVTPQGVQFMGQDPRKAVVVSEPMDLFTRRKEFVGGKVTLSGVPGGARTFLRTGVEYRNEASEPADPKIETKKLVDPATRAYGEVPGTEGRVWLVSEPVATLSDEPATRLTAGGSYAGVATLVYSDAQLGREWGNGLPYLGVGVVPAPDPEVRSLETWVPVEGDDSEIWVSFPGDVSDGAAGARGFYEGHVSAETAGPLLSALHARGGESRGRDLHVISGLGKWDYIKHRDLARRLLLELRWGALWTFMPGLLLIGWAAFIARDE